jgi:segregation and condensation protein A
VRLELAAEWLVMAAWLTWLKSRLLVPAGTDETEDAEQIAELLTETAGGAGTGPSRRRLARRRPILGADVFTLGAREDHTMIDRSRLVIDQAGVLVVLPARRPPRHQGGAYQPRKLSWFTVQDALKRLSSLLGSMPDWTSLEQFLPAFRRDRWSRAAMSSTLIAGLELARGGELRLRQEHASAQSSWDVAGAGGSAMTTAPDSEPDAVRSTPTGAR